MKKMKKLSAILLSLVIISAMFSTMLTADAANYSITINNAVPGETYTAYKLFDLTVENAEAPTAYAYTVNSAWKNNDSSVESSEKNDIRLTNEFKAVFEIDDEQYVTAKTGINSETAWTTSALSAFVSKAAAFAEAKGIANAGQKTAGEGETSVTIDTTNTGAGYYIIASSLGSRVMADSTPSNPAVTVNEKNALNELTKTVTENTGNRDLSANSAQIGDEIEYKLTVKIVARSVDVVIHDAMDDGLTLKEGSIKVYTDYKGPSTYTEYSDTTNPLKIRTGASADPDDDFTIEVPDAFAENATGDQTLTVIYNAYLNQNAITKDENGKIKSVDQVNKAKLTYGGSQSIEKTTITKTYSAGVFKHTSNDDKNALGGAVFQLIKNYSIDADGKKTYTVVNLKKLDDKNYRVVDATETGEPLSHMKGEKHVTVADGSIVSDFVTVNGVSDETTDSDIYIWGLDGDSSYSVLEILAPDGYNKLVDPRNIEWTPAENKVYEIDGSFSRTVVINDTGSELPSTGGVGAKIFYIAGGVLILGAAVTFVVRRKMKKDETA